MDYSELFEGARKQKQRGEPYGFSCTHEGAECVL